MVKKIYFLLILLFLLPESQVVYSNYSTVSAFRQADDFYIKIFDLINWLKSSYPDDNREKWDETCNLLVNWSVTDTIIDVTINVDIIQSLLEEKDFKYRVESVRIYILGVIAYSLNQSNYDPEEAAYSGLLDMINFYKIITSNNKSASSESINMYTKLDELGTLKAFVSHAFEKDKSDLSL